MLHKCYLIEIVSNYAHETDKKFLIPSEHHSFE